MLEGTGLELSLQGRSTKNKHPKKHNPPPPKKKRRKKKKSELSACLCNIMLSSKYGQSCMQVNGGKLVMQPKTDVGSKLPLTSFSATHPGLALVAAVKADMFLPLTLHPDIRETETE